MHGRQWGLGMVAVLAWLVPVVFVDGPAGAAPPASNAVQLSDRSADIRLLARRGEIEISVATPRPRAAARLTLTLRRGDRAIFAKTQDLAELAASTAAHRTFGLPALPDGDIGAVAQLTGGQFPAESQFLALRRHRGTLLTAGSFAQLEDAALTADRADGLLTDAAYHEKVAQLHRVVGRPGTVKPGARTAVSASGSGTATVSGRARYMAWNGQWFPIRQARVELDNADDNPIGYGFSDANGNFGFSATVTIGTYHLSVTAKNPYAEVVSPYTINPYFGSGPAIYLRPGDVMSGATLDLTYASVAGRAFALLDAAYTAGQFYDSIRKPGWKKSLTIVYPDGSDRNYAQGTDIYISGGDTDCVSGSLRVWCPENAFNWDVPAHELGHVVARQAGIDDSPGGTHYFCDSNWTASEGAADKAGAVGLAWSEGWAAFFGEVALYNGVPAGMPLAERARYHTEPGPPHTAGSQVSYSLEDRDLCPTQGDDDELAVQRALWDMWDDSTDEAVQWGFTDILDRLDAANATTFHQAVVALWAGRPTSQLDAARVILQDHGFAPSLTGPQNGVISQMPVDFTWSAGGPAQHPNNQFRIEIRDAHTGALLTSQTMTSPVFHPDAPTWRRLGEAGWVTVDLTGAEITGPASGPYAAPTRSLYIGGIPDMPRIMVVGDSISHGHEGDYTWRYRLKEHLTAAGQPSDFVGPYTGTMHLPATLPPDYPDTQPGPSFDGRYGPDGSVTFDSAHFAQWGRQAAQAKGDIGGAVATFQPDYLLVELGFNDIAWSISDPDGTVSSVRQLIDNARAAKPNIRILVANVVHRTPMSIVPWLDARTDDYNAKLAAALPATSTPVSPAALVDISGGYDPQLDTYDGLHPNGSGDYKIAKAFANVLSGQFGIGAPFTGTPPAMPPFRPAAPAALDATAVPGGVQITWQHSFGATGYWLYSRDATLGQGFERSALSIGADAWTASWVLAGHTYEYYVVPSRGNYLGDPSPTDSVVADPRTAGGPINIVVLPGSGYVDLSWDRPQTQYSSTVIAYRVHYFDGTAAGAIVQSTKTSNQSYRLSGLANGHKYIIAISSINDAGEGFPSVAPAVIPGYGRPAAPTLQSVRMTSPFSVKLAWTAVPGAAGYYTVSRNWFDGGPFGRYPTMSEETTSEIGWLFPADRQEFCIVAANGSLESASSNCLRATPDAPALLDAKILDESTVELRWTEVPGASTYQILKRRVQPGGGGTFFVAWTGNGLAHQVGYLDFSDEYEWCVVALADPDMVESDRSNIRLSHI